MGRNITLYIRIMVVIFCFVFIPWNLFSQGVTFSSSNLPIIIIDTHGGEIVDEPKIMATMKIINNGEGERNHVTDPANEYDGYIGIEYHGESSLSWPKKSYGIETRDSSGENNNVSLFGMPKENDWVLYGPFVDKTLMRNVLLYDLAAGFGVYAPRTQFVEMTLNGDYMGVYVFTEKIKKDKGRVDLSKPTEENITGGYLLEMINNRSLKEDETHFKLEEAGKEIVVKYPKKGKTSEEELQYISGWFNGLDHALNSDPLQEGEDGYGYYIDIPSFIDQMLLSEAFNQLDAFCQSTYFFKDQNEKLHLGPGWDYNRSMGNAKYYNSWRTDVWLLKEKYESNPDGWYRINWPARLMSDPSFMEKYGRRWAELRQGMFSLSYLSEKIDHYADLLKEARERNFQRWDVLGKDYNNKYVFDTYQEEIDYMKDWLLQKFTWLDEQFGRIRNYALSVNVTASGAEEGRPPENAVDGDPDTHWSNQTYPQWIEVDLGNVKEIDKTAVFPYKERAYHYIIETKKDVGDDYTLLVDRSDNHYPRLQFVDTFPRTEARFVRLNVTGADNYDGNWCSIDEFKVFGDVVLSAPLISAGSDRVFLEQNFPNPFRSATTIKYSLLQSGHVSLKIYSVNGTEVADLVEENKPAGNYEIKFNADKLHEGVYFYKIEVNGYSKIKRMIKIK